MTNQKKFGYAVIDTIYDLVSQFGINLICENVKDSKGVLIFGKNGKLNT